MCRFYCEVMGLDPSLHPSDEEQERIDGANTLVMEGEPGTYPPPSPGLVFDRLKDERGES